MCRLRNSRTDWNILPAQALVSDAAKEGVTPYIHPLLYSSQRPLLLVEGGTDRRYLKLAYRLLDRLNPFVISDMRSLDPAVDLQGVDGLRSYLRSNRGALKTRPLDSPVFVLVDWNVSPKKIDELEREISCHGTSKVIQWQEEECNHSLDQSFRGIERALSHTLIQEAERKDFLKTLRPSANDLPLTLVRDSLEKTKLVELAEIREQQEDFAHFKPLLDRLDKELKDSLQKAERIIDGTLFPGFIQGS